MKHSEREKIKIPESAEVSEIRDRIDSWRETDVGQDYDIKKWESHEITLKKSWIDNFCIVFVLLTALPSFIEYIYSMQISWLGLFFSALSLFIYLGLLSAFFRDQVRIEIFIEDSEVNLTLDSTRKEEKDIAFDSLRKALQGRASNSKSSPIS